MKKNIEQLSAIAAAETRMIIGLMSGTSLDGLDIALCEISYAGIGTRVNLRHFTTKPYEDIFTNEVRKIFAKKNIAFEQVCVLNEWIAEQHAIMILDALAEWHIDPSSIDLLASHGQTVFHSPKSSRSADKFGNSTLQIGDGDHLAIRTGIITISDFRQKHIAAGGEGAPLAAYGDYLLFKEEDKNVILLNIGGIANISFLPLQGNIFSTDLGPGNTLMDACIQLNYPGQNYDKDASIALQGSVSDSLLSELLNDDFFRLTFPKTTGPEHFNLEYLTRAQSRSGTESLRVEDVMATLNRFAATVIIDTINNLTKDDQSTVVYISGGGLNNPLLKQHLVNGVKNARLLSTAEKGIDPDAKEAILFALLANETVSGDIRSFPQGLDNFPAVSMGKISFPL